jgi:hypothetical protein
MFSSLVCLVAVLPAPSAWGGEKEPELTNFGKAMCGLDNKEIRPGLTSDKLLGMCIPSLRRTIGRFTEYTFEGIPGYHGITIIAKNGRLKYAKLWSCTFFSIYFSEMTDDDWKQYWEAWKSHTDVPDERITERWGWERPRMRDWGRDRAAPPRASRTK